jgi:serine/threonine protein kinase
MIDATIPEEDWRTILHLDIHPGNILLGDSDHGYPYYQRSVLTNFEQAICLDKDEARRKKQFADMRYQGQGSWRAPERSRGAQRVPAGSIHRPESWDLDQSTDVYNVGLVIRYMMCCTMVINGESFKARVQDNEESDIPKKARGEMKDHDRFPWSSYPRSYSISLVRTAQKCLRFLPFRKDATAEMRDRSKPSLLELFTIINENLAQLDSMYGSTFEAAQSVANHPLRVLFPKDVARFRMGAVFESAINPSVDALTHTLKEKRLVDITREFIKPYTDFLPGGITAPDNPIFTLSQVPDQLLAQVLSETEKIAREKITVKTQVSKRDLQLISVEHATTNAMKAINPNGVFTQHHWIATPRFYHPAEKLAAIGHLRTACAAQREALRSDLERLRADVASHKEDFADPSYDEAAREILRAIISSAKSSIDATDDTLDALRLLRDALSFGMALIALGGEMAIDEHTYEDYWAHVLPRVYRGVWDYYRSVPDLVRKLG